MNELDFEKYDPQGMHNIYDQWPEIAKDSFHSDLDPADFHDIEHVIFSGMGGSGSLGDVFSSILSQSGLFVSVVKGYHLPEKINEKTLVVATSVSGNTQETLSTLDCAVKSKAQVIAFSDNGKIQEFCNDNKLEHRTIPMIHSPRGSFPRFLFSMVKVLQKTLQIKNEDIIESLNELTKTNEKISSVNLQENNPSLSLAKWISGIPLIYYPWGLQSAAIRFKNSMQENAKSHIIIEDVVEACHNGICAWEKKSNVRPILLEGQDDYFKTKERWKILKDFFDREEIEYREIRSTHGSILTKIINLIYLLDYSTIYYAILSKTDPSPIKSIDFLKKFV